jgi:hypothetical protein
MVGRLSCLLKNSTHLQRLAIMKSDLSDLLSVSLELINSQSGTAQNGSYSVRGGDKSQESLI